MAQQGGVSLLEWGGHWFPEYSIEFRTKNNVLISKLCEIALGSLHESKFSALASPGGEGAFHPRLGS